MAEDRPELISVPVPAVAVQIATVSECPYRWQFCRDLVVRLCADDLAALLPRYSWLHKVDEVRAEHEAVLLKAGRLSNTTSARPCDRAAARRFSV